MNLVFHNASELWLDVYRARLCVSLQAARKWCCHNAPSTNFKHITLSRHIKGAGWWHHGGRLAVIHTPQTDIRHWSDASSLHTGCFSTDVDEKFSAAARTKALPIDGANISRQCQKNSKTRKKTCQKSDLTFRIAENGSSSTSFESVCVGKSIQIHFRKKREEIVWLHF